MDRRPVKERRKSYRREGFGADEQFERFVLRASAVLLAARMVDVQSSIRKRARAIEPIPFAVILAVLNVLLALVLWRFLFAV